MGKSSPTTNSKTILIIEDDQKLIDVLKAKLIITGTTILTAANGEEGLKLAFAHKPNLIILDLIMPVLDGFDVIKRLKKDEWGKEVKVIILTNTSVDGHLESLVANMNCKYLIKSETKLEEIVEAIEKALKD